MKRLSWLVVPFLALSLAAPAAHAADAPSALVSPKPYVTASQVETPLAQGLTLTAFERLYPGGFVNGWLLQVSLSHPAIATDLITAPGLTQGEPLSAMASRAGAVAAINGDFFDIGQTGIALGAVVRSGQFLQSRIPDWPHAAGVTSDRIGRLLEVTLEGTVTLPGGSYRIGAINLPTLPGHSIGLYTPLWTISRERALYGAAEGCEVVVQGGRVIAVNDRVTDHPIPRDGFVLVGREEYAPLLAALKVGDPVSVSYQAKPDLLWAVGGRQYLVKDGQIADLDDTQRAPRSALGFSADGRQMFLLAVDGRSGASSGLTLREVAEAMVGFGAAHVLELDGGGSTTMVARLPGADGLSVVNRPSDGRERPVPNGVAVFAAPGSGVAHSLQVEGEDRVFPGLTRRLEVRGLDEQFGPAPVGPVTWSVEGVGEISPDGIFRSEYPGMAMVTASSVAPDETAVSGRFLIRVLGRLTRIEPDVEGLILSPGQTGRFTVRGYDFEGFRASIDPADLTLTFDESLLRVEAKPDGVHVTPLREGEGLIRVTVQGKETWVPVASSGGGVLDAFDRLDGWVFQRYPQSVTGQLSTAPGRSGNGLKLSYAFGPHTGNRAAYAEASPNLELAGQPEKIGLWVKGDGQGAWLRAVLIDANGTSYTLDLARRVDWTDWRYVEAAVPAGVAYPVRLHRIYPVETDTSKQYQGELIFDDLIASSPVALPPVPEAPPAGIDPVLQPGAVGEGAWRFALVAGLPLEETAGGQVQGQPPTQGSQAQELIRQAMASRPAFVLVDPALATPAGEALVHLEAGATPVYRMASPAQQFDLNGIRFIVLGTDRGGLRATQFEQLLRLKEMLDQARQDPGVKRLVVVSHHGPNRFADRREGELIIRWLADFEQTSSKDVAYVASGGSGLAVVRVEGVPIIEAGSPQAPLIFTMDPTPGAPWIRVQTP